MDKRGLLIFGALLLVVGTAWGQTQTIDATAPAGSDGKGVAGAIRGSWSQGDFSCNAVVPGDVRRAAQPAGLQDVSAQPGGATPAPQGPSAWLVVTCVPSSCGGEQVWAVFEVTSGAGTTNAAHTIDYRVTSTASGLSHEIGFDGGSLESIDGGVFTFNLTDSDVIRITTGQSTLGTGGGLTPPSAPALGLAGTIGGMLLIGGATAWRLRRRG